jgi:hypothetical protein
LELRRCPSEIPVVGTIYQERGSFNGSRIQKLSQASYIQTDSENYQSTTKNSSSGFENGESSTNSVQQLRIENQNLRHTLENCRHALKQTQHALFVYEQVLSSTINAQETI